MRPISIDEIAARLGSRFDLVVAAAKRAGQIKDGAPPLIDTQLHNPLSIALEEIAVGKVLLKPAEELPEEPEPAVQDYLARRGSLQDQIAGYVSLDDDEEDEEEEEGGDEEEFDEDFEEDEDEDEEPLEVPFDEELEEENEEEQELEEEAGYSFEEGEEPDQADVTELEGAAEDVEDAYLEGEAKEE